MVDPEHKSKGMRGAENEPSASFSLFSLISYEQDQAVDPTAPFEVLEPRRKEEPQLQEFLNILIRELSQKYAPQVAKIRRQISDFAQKAGYTEPGTSVRLEAFEEVELEPEAPQLGPLSLGDEMDDTPDFPTAWQISGNWERKNELLDPDEDVAEEESQAAHSPEPKSPQYLAVEDESDGLRIGLAGRNIEVAVSQEQIGRYFGKLEEAESQEPPSRMKRAAELIDRFLQADLNLRKKAVPSDEKKENAAALSSLDSDENLVSETLAKLLVKQGNLAEAQRVYEKLTLLFPQKSSYFAALIDQMKDEK